MIPLTFLYDEYIDRPNLTEQKKPIWVYSSFPHLWGKELYTQMGFFVRSNLADRYSTSIQTTVKFGRFEDHNSPS